MNDPDHLQRFVDAQNPVFDEVRSELRAGRKRSHWMWFVFPQLEGLGQSYMARHYGIASRQEAEAYLAHPALGPRLRECVDLVMQVQGRTIREILGRPDDMKLRSCLTLFARAASDNQIFEDALRKYYGGEPDQVTLDRLSDQASGKPD